MTMMMMPGEENTLDEGLEEVNKREECISERVVCLKERETFFDVGVCNYICGFARRWRFLHNSYTR